MSAWLLRVRHYQSQRQHPSVALWSLLQLYCALRQSKVRHAANTKRERLARSTKFEMQSSSAAVRSATDGYNS